MTVQAEDPDQGATSTTIVYQLISGNHHGSFSLDPRTGQLRLNRSLDIYQRQKYQLTVRASEYRPRESKRNITSLSSTAILSVDVIDVNNNPPKFSQKIYYASVEENMPVGTVVTKVSATDADLSPQNKAFVFEVCFRSGKTKQQEGREGIIQKRMETIELSLNKI